MIDMGWAYCGTDEDGREIGYAIEAECDHPDCHEKIDRGLSYVCGNMHGGDEWGCGKYFCPKHLYLCLCPDGVLRQFCEKCYDRLKAEGRIAQEDAIYKLLTNEEEKEE